MSRLSLAGATWRPAPVDPVALSQLQDVDDVMARCLALRWGVDAPSDTAALRPELGHLHDPWGMLGMEAAVDRVRRAARDGERVRIITDYDVDGTTSSLVLQAALGIVGPAIDLDYHIPDRFLEGYGFSVHAANKAVEDGVNLIITADIGVRDHAAVAAARAGGVDVLICDHHLPAGASVPSDAIVLCPPQRDCTYANPDLAACGVSLKLAQALLEGRSNQDRILRSLMKLAAIGTVADVVSLAGAENRAIVGLGLEELNRSRHNAGLTALLSVSGSERGKIGVYDLGWRLGPRINAAGRVADATHVVELLNCREPKRAEELAQSLDSLNRDRRRVQAALQQLAEQQLAEQDTAFPVLAGIEEEGWHRGVVGIVAGRLKEALLRPVAVLAIEKGQARGSVRSPPHIHAVHALDHANGEDELLVRYGGHAAAAGFTVELENLPAVRERLAAYAESHADDLPAVVEVDYDAEVRPDELTLALADRLAEMGPFGQGNPAPVLLVRGARLGDFRVTGSGTHLGFKVRRPAGGRVKGIAWRRADWRETLAEGPVDLLVKLEVDTYRGRQAQVVLEDARPTAG